MFHFIFAADDAILKEGKKTKYSQQRAANVEFHVVVVLVQNAAKAK